MPPETFLHERSDFKALIETVASSEKINDPALVEKDEEPGNQRAQNKFATGAHGRASERMDNFSEQY